MKASLLIALALSAFAAQAAEQAPAEDHPHGDWKDRPHAEHAFPEALKACDGKKEGDKVSFKTHRGDTMEASCKGMPPHAMMGKHHRPPQDVVKACEGKRDGETVSIKTPHGDAMTAVCKTLPLPLIAMPEHPPRHEGGDKPAPRP